MKTGIANLPLHYGRVPTWLSSRMTQLARVITEAIIYHYGRDEMLRRLAHPFWFQCFGAVMGMDWHSSGITTSTLFALKKGLQPIQKELGIYICGGRGTFARKTPQELEILAERLSLNSVSLIKTSRLVAKVDSNAVQDGYQLYLHNFILTSEGKWVVVQQGMNPINRQARRYHWLSEHLVSFVQSPHTGIEGPAEGKIINLTDERAKDSREIQTQMILKEDPQKLTQQFTKILPHLVMPIHHDVKKQNINIKRLYATFEAAKNRGPQDFAELLLTPGLGERSLWALTMVAEVIHGAPAHFKDPARFSLAHGGKDAHPYPVPLKVYDETLRVLKTAISQAKLGNSDKLSAIQKLDEETRNIDQSKVVDMDWKGFAEEQWKKSKEWRGKYVS